MPGLEFYRMDLHVHTPASSCYLHHGHTEKDIVDAAIAAGMNAIAITDHNTGEWIDRVKKAANGTDLVVFPGVEISTSLGYHVVALLDPSAGRSDAENLLGALDVFASSYGKPDALCKSALDGIMDAIHDRGGLAVLPHRQCQGSLQASDHA